MLHILVFVYLSLPQAFSASNKSGPGSKGNIVLNARHQESLFKAVYWEVKPYIFRNKDGQLDGVYATIFKNAVNFCGRNQTIFNLYNASKLIDMETFRMRSRREFLKLYKSNTYPEGLIPGRDVYFPAIFRSTEEIQEIEKKKGFLNFDIAHSDSLAIVVRRDYISLPFKIYRGIASCGQIFFISFLLTIFFGVLMWLAERVNNPGFPDTFFTGTGAGVWWSFVSMTTVGYGDVVPRSIIGRAIAVIWVCIGVMIACIVTATVTEVVNGVSDLDVANKRVAVLEDSFETERVEVDLRAIPVGMPTYEAVYDAVRKGEVFAAAVNAEVAAWNIDEIHNDQQENPLRVVMRMEAHLNLNMVFSGRIPTDFKQIIKCMHSFQTEVYTRAKTKFGRYCPTETLYIESVADLFKSVFVQVLLGLIVLLFVVGLSVDFHYRRNLKKKSGIDREEDQEMISSPLNGFAEKGNGYV